MSIPTVFISAGHNQLAQGAINKQLNLSEHSQAKKIALALAKANLVDKCCQYCYVPAPALTDKVNYINDRCAEGSIALEIHFNASRSKGQGTETLYYPSSLKGKILAGLIQTNLMRALPFSDRGIKPRDDLHFLTATKIPAIIAEILFIDHDLEATYLLHPRAHLIIARALHDGIIKYFNPSPEEAA